MATKKQVCRNSLRPWSSRMLRTEERDTIRSFTVLGAARARASVRVPHQTKQKRSRSKLQPRFALASHITSSSEFRCHWSVLSHKKVRHSQKFCVEDTADPRISHFPTLASHRNFLMLLLSLLTPCDKGSAQRFRNILTCARHPGNILGHLDQFTPQLKTAISI